MDKQLDRKRGYLALDNFDYGSLFNTSFPMNKADRIATFDSGSTHALSLIHISIVERVLEEELHLRVFDALLAQVDDALQHEVSLLQLVVEKEIIL